MRTHETSSPSAAELYFNESIFGQLLTVFAETLGKTEPGGRPGQAQSAQGNGLAVPPGGLVVRPMRETAQPPTAATPRRTLFERIDAWFWRQEQRDREAYLARSRDVFELERRIRALERGPVTRDY